MQPATKGRLQPLSEYFWEDVIKIAVVVAAEGSVGSISQNLIVHAENMASCCQMEHYTMVKTQKVIIHSSIHVVMLRIFFFVFGQFLEQKFDIGPLDLGRELVAT